MPNRSCKNTVLQFNGKHYTEVDRAMGSSIPSLMADVFMNQLVDNISKFGCSLYILGRYVHDIFCVFHSKHKMVQSLSNFNKAHSSVRFLKQVEAEGQLAYFDIPLTKTETGIEISICSSGS